MLTYILQIATICITLGLGLFSAYQTKKIEHGQNIISVTTNYRLKRSEQLKEYARILLTHTNPDLLAKNTDILREAVNAYEGISAILHRHFQADNELILLAKDIVEIAVNYPGTTTRTQLEKKRELFRIKCDIYTTADWNRIKQETKGVNTSSTSWIEYYTALSKEYSEEIKKLQ